MSEIYTKSFRMRVVKEAVRPENQGMEHIIAKKYGIKPGTVERWKEIYLENGADSFKKGFSKKNTKTQHEIELEKQVADLEEEVKILKKAAAFQANVKHE